MGVLAMGFTYLSFAVAHFFQIVLGVTVCGLYGTYLNRASQEGKYQDGKWVYAVVVGGLSAVSAFLLMIPFVMRVAFTWAWGYILSVLWIALFGLFGAMYIHENPEGDGDIQKMKNAVWVDLVNAVLWFLTSTAGFIYWWTHRERQSRFTSRAKV